MKLSSRYIKPGDTIIRIAPHDKGDIDFMCVPCTVVKKSPYYTEISVPDYVGGASVRTVILNHHDWNDNKWVRYI